MKVKLKEEGEYVCTWIAAHTVALIAEVIAIHSAVKTYHLNHSFYSSGLIPLVGIMPWVGAMQAMRRYRHMNELVVGSDIRRDLSTELGGMVLWAYLLFMTAAVVS